MSDVIYKQYIIVIKSLCETISRAKFGVHCAHASICAIDSLDDNQRGRYNDWMGRDAQTKIVKEITSLEKLKNIMNKSLECHLPYGMIPDAGFTSETKSGTYLMGCVGPITEKEAKKLGIWRLSNYRG